MQDKKKLELAIEVDVLTAGTTAEIVNAILETLLFQRNQIPFVYKTYRYYINKWQQEDEQSNPNGENFAMQNFHVQRKKYQATNTKEAIGSMRQVIKTALGRRAVKSLRFLLGSTIFTAKEAYTVHIPTENIAVNHFHEHHEMPQNKLNQTLLSLLTNEELYTVFSNNLNPTNIFLELEILENEINVFEGSKSSLQNFGIFPKDFSSLPPSCKDIHIYLVHKQSQPTNYELLRCCKELQVFEDLINLSLECKTENLKSPASEKTKQNLMKSSSSVWWEAEIFVRGFKDQPIKGFNMWT